MYIDNFYIKKLANIKYPDAIYWYYFSVEYVFLTDEPDHRLYLHI